MTALIEQITYGGDIRACKLNSCTRALDIAGSYLMFSARTLFNGRSVFCYQEKDKDTGKITLQFDDAKFPKKNLWRVLLAIILFFPLTPLGLLVKGSALICSKNLRDYYFEFHESCKRPPSPKGPTNVSHINNWPKELEPYKDYQDNLYYSLDQGHQNCPLDQVRHTGIDLKHILWNATFPHSCSVRISRRGMPEHILFFNNDTACLGHIRAFLYAHAIAIGTTLALKPFANGQDDTQKIKDVIASSGSSTIEISDAPD